MRSRCQVRTCMGPVDVTDFGDGVTCHTVSLWPRRGYMTATKETSLKEHFPSSLLGEDCAPLHGEHIGHVSAPGPLLWPSPALQMLLKPQETHGCSLASPCLVFQMILSTLMTTATLSVQLKNADLLTCKMAVSISALSMPAVSM